MQWRLTWDLKSIPDAELHEEVARRRREKHLVQIGVCNACGSETAWMGTRVRCEECNEGVYEPRDH